MLNKHSEVQPVAAEFLALELDSNALIEQMIQAKGWQDKYRYIMLNGKLLPKLDDNLRNDNALIRGCESNAWLYHKEIDGQHYFLADSDARIVKGLMTILLAACHGKTSDDIDNFDPQAYFIKLGLDGQLSPSRTNGLFALVQTIKSVT